MSFAEGDFKVSQAVIDSAVEAHEPKGGADGGTHHGFDVIIETPFSWRGTERGMSRSPQRESSTAVIPSLDFSLGV